MEKKGIKPFFLLFCYRIREDSIRIGGVFLPMENEIGRSCGNPSTRKMKTMAYYEDDYYDNYDYPTYDNYNGSYAQDVEGWSDQMIDDALDGDPEAYWNID